MKFPLIDSPIPEIQSVPWEKVAPYEARAYKNHEQTLRRLAERGGLSPSELWCVVHDKPLYDFPTEETALVWLREWIKQ